MKAQLFCSVLLSIAFFSQLIETSSTRKNMFGTDGIRATVGSSPFTATELHNMGKAIGKWIIERYGQNATVLIGHDTRLSCSFVKSSLKSGLLSYPVCLIDGGVIPTPAVVQLALKHDNISCGIVISASHNSFEDNGIKIIDGSCGKLSLQDEQKITEYFYMPTLKYNYTQLGEEQYWQKSLDVYINYITHFFEPNFLFGKKIVLDCAHGATHACAVKLFEQLGATVIPFANKPNGRNINEQCGAVHPEQCAQLVVEHNADAGFSFDGDGDRVMAINKKGEIKNGDDVLALLLEHPVYRDTTVVVGTIMTNKGLEEHLKEKNIVLYRTPVGDKYIARALQEHENWTIGGEQSGHTILYDYLPTGDGIFTALRVMEAILNTSNFDMLTFKRFPQLLINVPVQEKRDLTAEPYASIIKEYEKQLTNGRLVVRFSGTEQKLRVMIEDENKNKAQKIGSECAIALQKALEGK